MDVGRVGVVIIGLVFIVSLTSCNAKSENKVARSPDRYTALIKTGVQKALLATDGYYIPIKYDDYDKAKVLARDYKVLTDKMSHILDDCPADRYNEKNMLKAALNVVANRTSSLWAYMMYVEARATHSPNVGREQERATKYIDDAEKYRQYFRNTYGF